MGPSQGEPVYDPHMGPFREGWTVADVEAVVARGDPSVLLYVPLVVSMSPPGRVCCCTSPSSSP
jgi:hypothetical protein